MDELGISADELQVLLQITNSPVAVTERQQHLDNVIAAAHLLLPFDRCLVLHEHLQHTQALFYRSGAELERRSGSTFPSEHPLQIKRYLESFSRFGIFQNAFFWFARQPRAPVDHSIAALLREAALTEGIAGAINTSGDRNRRSATLVQLQYCQQRFEAKHLVFANFIASCLHTYFEQHEDATCTLRPARTFAALRTGQCRSHVSCHEPRRSVNARRHPPIALGIRRSRRACRHLA